MRAAVGGETYVFWYSAGWFGGLVRLFTHVVLACIFSFSSVVLFSDMGYVALLTCDEFMDRDAYHAHTVMSTDEDDSGSPRFPCYYSWSEECLVGVFHSTAFTQCAKNGEMLLRLFYQSCVATPLGGILSFHLAYLLAKGDV